MSRRILLALALLLATPTLWAKDKIIMPDVITHATYVMVRTYDGDLFSPNVIPEDRQAIADVQKALEKWGRYTLVYRAQEAELILVVRTGRAVEVREGLSRGTRVGPGGTPGVGPDGSTHVTGAEVGDPQDTLEAFIAPADIDTATPLWRGRAVDGLKAPEIPLMKEFRQKVEAAAAKKH